MMWQWQAWTTLGAVVLMISLLCATRIPSDLITMGVLTLLLTLGILPPAEALSGFSNQGLITIAALFVVATGIRETAAMSLLADRLLGRPRSVLGAQARLMFLTAFLSAFIYDTPLVAMLLPVVADWAKKVRVPASQLMIPLAYAAALGGVCTLIGTSTNLLVDGLLVSQGKQPPLRFFDTTWVGLPCALAGLVYLLIANRWLLPQRRPAFSAADDPREYTVEMLVEHTSPLVGQTIEQAGLRHLPGLFLAEIERAGQVVAAVGPQERLQAKDRLVFVGILDSVVDLQKMRGLKPATEQVFKLDSPRSHRCLIEAVVSNTCPLAGKTIREGQFRTVYQAVVIALARNGERVRKKLGDIVLRPGDTLLLEAHPWFVEQQRNSRDFFLVSRVENSTPGRHEKAWVAGAIVAGLVLVVSLGWLTMVNGALLAAALMILTRCCDGAEARRSLDLRILLVIAAALGIGHAIEYSGLAGGTAHALLALAGKEPWVALAIIYGLTMVFTELMSHHASVVLIFPLAVATAQGLGVSIMPFAIAILMAASCVFATPLGSQPNLMVSGPGGYRFTDYLWLGIPLNLLIWVLTVLLTPLVWPFR
jgi:di/tricarboxylate transporter